MTRTITGLLLGVLLAGCQSLAGPPAEDTLYQDLGERTGIANIVRDLLYVVVEDERIAETFRGVDIASLHRNLTDQICYLANGPCTYSGRSMEASHAGLGIDETDFNALAEDLILAMEQNDVPVSAQNRLLKRLVPLHDEIVDIPTPRPSSN
ncbi:group I truncated hemoglobin [Marinobacter bohaiensis]|uniref:group I truncated hemoglobin n=1 Tax=Marinobacter bohaiensis TaxID=2201898 RepID=UPI000DAE22D4|nr:group 1 truncated hemoglobin [Marinobacter bohaiensis]